MEIIITILMILVFIQFLHFILVVGGIIPIASGDWILGLFMLLIGFSLWG